MKKRKFSRWILLLCCLFIPAFTAGAKAPLGTPTREVLLDMAWDCLEEYNFSCIRTNAVAVSKATQIMSEKENKTNAMRILDKNKINYEVNTYECDEFIDGVHIADMLGQPYESTFKTLVTEGKSKNYYVFAIPIALELDMKKAAKAVGEKSIEMVHVKDINAVTGYIRGGCTPIGMKKQYKTVYHSTIKDFDKVIVSGGKLGTQIILAPDDLIKVTRADVCDIVKD